ncbi:hypothetical protein Tco_0591607, partial [Tanacetum coccineum]
MRLLKSLTDIGMKQGIAERCRWGRKIDGLLSSLQLPWNNLLE